MLRSVPIHLREIAGQGFFNGHFDQILEVYFVNDQDSQKNFKNLKRDVVSDLESVGWKSLSDGDHYINTSGQSDRIVAKKTEEIMQLHKKNFSKDTSIYWLFLSAPKNTSPLIVTAQLELKK
jgi:hypothetical protein